MLSFPGGIEQVVHKTSKTSEKRKDFKWKLKVIDN